MGTLEATVLKRPALTYYVLVFLVSWGGVLAVVGGPSGLPGTPDDFLTLFPRVVVALLAGPVLAGLACVGLTQGRAGYRDLGSRVLRWRLGARWFAVSLLAAPLAMTLLPLACMPLAPELMPSLVARSDTASVVGLAIGAGLAAGIFEEIGWTGFAIPTLRRRYGVRATGLIVGFLWGCWHLIVNLWSSGAASGALEPTLLAHSLLFSLAVLPAFRVLMVWVYEHTSSLGLAMLMHTSLTASNVLFVPAATGSVLAAWSLLIAAPLWIMLVFLRPRAARAPKPGGLATMLRLTHATNGMNIVGQGGRILLFTLPAVVAAVAAHVAVPELVRIPLPAGLLRPLGVALVLPGVVLWLIAVTQLLLGFPRGRLLRTGAYGVCRNPIYASFGVFVLPGLALATGTWVYLGVALVLCAAVHLFIRREERELLEVFGDDYRDYTTKVRRLLPFVRPARGATDFSR